MRSALFSIDPKGAPARACAGLVLASAAVRLVWFCISRGTAADAYTLIVHLVVPFLSCALLAAFILRGALRLCTIPVGLGCLFFVLKALSFSSRIHTVLCCILYALVFSLYAATAFGLLKTRVPLGLVFTLPLLYHIFVEDLAKLRAPVPPTLVEWMPEFSVLLIMAALATAAWGMKKRE
ncbi:MAG: hypothetical protein KIC63_01270 [Clostridium sp.]|nr:hypothetical protein [Clostridium sp.]